jgi:hypothetical protein
MKVEVAVAVVVVVGGGGGGEGEEIVLELFASCSGGTRFYDNKKKEIYKKIKIKKDGKDVERRLRKKERGKERSEKENQFC